MCLFGTPVKVPVIDVNSENIKEIWPSLCLAVKTATFIGVDTELSGLGDRKVLNARSIEDRYKGLSAVAKSRSILSLGLSCYKLIPNKESTSKWCYCIQTYNIMVLCSEDYVVEPLSLKFLVDHSFDFNKQYSTGAPYYRGNDKNNSSLNSPTVRGIFSLIVHWQVPLVFHNALVDLVFLYQSFYADLPTKLTSFVADLSEMFPGGVFDTKYITDYIERLEASYLEYVFLQCQRENQEQLKEKKRAIYFEFPVYPDSYEAVGYHPCGYIPRNWTEAEIENLRPKICLCFAAHGWCNKPRACTLIHDVDLTISIGYLLTAKQRRNRKRYRNRKFVNKNNNEVKNTTNNSASRNNSDNEGDTKTENESNTYETLETYASVVKKPKLDVNGTDNIKTNSDVKEKGNSNTCADKPKSDVCEKVIVNPSTISLNTNSESEKIPDNLGKDNSIDMESSEKAENSEKSSKALKCPTKISESKMVSDDLGKDNSIDMESSEKAGNSEESSKVLKCPTENSESKMIPDNLGKDNSIDMESSEKADNSEELSKCPTKNSESKMIPDDLGQNNSISMESSEKPDNSEDNLKVLKIPTETCTANCAKTDNISEKIPNKIIGNGNNDSTVTSKVLENPTEMSTTDTDDIDNTCISQDIEKKTTIVTEGGVKTEKSSNISKVLESPPEVLRKNTCHFSRVSPLNDSGIESMEATSNELLASEACSAHQSGLEASNNCSKTCDIVSEAGDKKASPNSTLKTEKKSDLSASRSGCHRAGFDAFMTAAILSVFISKHNTSLKFDTKSNSHKLSDFSINNLKNKIYLTGKDIPLVIAKSSFSKCSTDHKIKLEKLKHCGL